MTPGTETQNLVLIDAARLRMAEKLIIACEGCSPKDSEIPFDHVLDRVTGNDPANNGLHFRSACEVSAVQAAD